MNSTFSEIKAPPGWLPAAAQGLGDLGHVGGRGVPETAPGEPGEVGKNGGKMVEKWENGGKMMDKCG